MVLSHHDTFAILRSSYHFTNAQPLGDHEPSHEYLELTWKIKSTPFKSHEHKTPNYIHSEKITSGSKKRMKLAELPWPEVQTLHRKKIVALLPHSPHGTTRPG